MQTAPTSKILAAVVALSLSGHLVESVSGQTTISYANPAVYNDTAVSSTASSTDITVTDGTKYAAGDVIRFYGTTTNNNPFGTTATYYYITSVSGNTITVSTTPGGTAVAAVNTTTASTTYQGQNLLNGSNWTGGTAPNGNTIVANFGNTAANIPAYVVNGSQTLYGLTFNGGGSSDIALVSSANGTSLYTLTFATSDASTPKMTLNGTTRLIALGTTGTGSSNMKLALAGNQGIVFNSVAGGALTGSGLSATSTDPSKQIRLQNVDWSSFSGGMTIERGELRINGSGGVLPSQTLTVGNAQTIVNDRLAGLNLSSFGSTVDALNGNSLGRIYGNSTLTVGNANGSGEYGGVIGATFTGTANATALTKVGSGTQTISGNIVGTGAITVNGAGGALVISGTNTSSGAATITAGTLRANDGVGLSTSSALTLSGGVLESIGVVSFTRAMGTAAGTVQWGAGGGGFSANGGKMTVNIGGAAAELVYGSTAGVNLQGTLNFGSTAANAETELVNGIDLAGTTRTVDVTAGAGGDYATLSGNIRSTSGSNIGLTKTGTGTLVLKGANTYDGTTTINGGTLEVSGGSAISDAGAVSLANTAGVTFKLSGNETIGSLSGGGTTGGNVDLQANKLTAGGANTSTSFGGVISGTGGSLVKSGTGTFTINNTNNAFTGGITIADGTLIGMGTSGYNPFGANAIQFGDSANNNVTLQLGGWNNLVSSNAVNVVGSGTHTLIGTHNSTGQVHIAGGAISLNTNDLTIRNTSAAGWRINGGVTGVGNLQFENNNAGGTGNDISVRSALNNTGSVINAGTGNYNLTILGAYGGSISTNVTSIIQDSATSAFDLNAVISSFNTATVEVRQGSMLLNNATALRVANTVSVGTDGTLDVRTANTIAGLNNYSGNGGTVLNNSASDTTLTVGGSGNYSFGGVLADGTNGGKLLLTKSGAGTQTLTGSNSYTGATTVSEGTLKVDGAINSSATVQSGASLGGIGKLASATIASGGTIAPGSSPGTLTLTNGLTFSGGGNYDWEIFGVSGTAGQTNTWDWINISGGDLTLTGLSSSNKFNINLVSLSALPSTGGVLAGFTNTSSYSWTILSASNGLAGLNTAHFNINDSAFATYNPLGGGMFSLAAAGDNLNLLFTPGGPTPIPEPGTWAAAAVLAGCATLVRWRRRKPAGN